MSIENTYILDNFTMVCPWNQSGVDGKIQISDLSFNLTKNNGILSGHWAVTGNTAIPDTIVAFGAPDIPGDPYRWVLELQCVEELGVEVFVGINFYSRSNLGPEAERSYQEMLAAAIRVGIDKYWDTKKGLRRVDHAGCFY
jgi:hypothetical protein